MQINLLFQGKLCLAGKGEGIHRATQMGAGICVTQECAPPLPLDRAVLGRRASVSFAVPLALLAAAVRAVFSRREKRNGP